MLETISNPRLPNGKLEARELVTCTPLPGITKSPRLNSPQPMLLTQPLSSSKMLKPFPTTGETPLKLTKISVTEWLEMSRTSSTKLNQQELLSRTKFKLNGLQLPIEFTKVMSKLLMKFSTTMLLTSIKPTSIKLTSIKPTTSLPLSHQAP